MSWNGAIDHILDAFSLYIRICKYDKYHKCFVVQVSNFVWCRKMIRDRGWIEFEFCTVMIHVLRSQNTTITFFIEAI